MRGLATTMLCLATILAWGWGCRGQAPTSAASVPATRTVSGAVETTKGQPAVQGPASDTRPMGIGLSQVVDWSTQFPFINLVKQARSWVFHEPGKAWGKGARAPVDERGWIRSLNKGQRAELIVLIAEGGTVPFERFAVSWKGQGSLRYRGNAKRVGKGPTGFNDTVQLTAPNGRHYFAIELMSTNPADPLRDIVVVAEKFVVLHQKGERFNPDWLARLKPFRSLRFMDWMQTNNAWSSSWSKRAQVADLSYRGRGVPLEVMIDLANQLQVDPWFTLPHLADDAYIRAFAELVKTRLQPGRVAWFEHSNEVWNWMFGQAKHANAAGRIRWRDTSVLGPALKELSSGRTKKTDLSVLDKAKMAPDLEMVLKDLVQAGLHQRFIEIAPAGPRRQQALHYLLSRMLGAAPGNSYVQHNGMRAAQLCDIVKKEVFVGSTNRVRCVIALQTANYGLVDSALRCPNWSQAPCVDHGFDALAVTGYLGVSATTGRNAAVIKRWSNEGDKGVRALVAELRQQNKLPDAPTDLAQVTRHFKHHAKVAKQYGLQLVAYEGGQHLTAGALQKDKKVLAMLKAASAHPDMGLLYGDLLDAWKAAGGTMFMHFVDVSACSRSGCWGAMENYEDAAPKYQALVDWSAAHPRWW